MARVLCTRRSIVGALGAGLTIAAGLQSPKTPPETRLSMRSRSTNDMRIGLLWSGDDASSPLRAIQDAFGHAKRRIEVESLTIHAQGDQMSALALLSAGCDLTIAVGEEMGEAVNAIARTRGARPFVAIGCVVPQFNVRSYTFRLEEACYQAGVLAATQTSVGQVAVDELGDPSRITEFVAGLTHRLPSATISGSDSTTADLFFTAGEGRAPAVLERRQSSEDSGRSVIGSSACRYDVAVLDAVASWSDRTFAGGHLDLGLSEGAVAFVTDSVSIRRGASFSEEYLLA